MSDEVIALLEQIREGQYLLGAEFRALREALESSRRREVQPQPDAATADLLREIKTAVRGRNFNTAELAVHAALPAAVNLHAAITSAAGAANPRKLGKLLRRIEGCDFDGLTVRRVGTDRDGVIWTVSASLRV